MRTICKKLRAVNLIAVVLIESIVIKMQFEKLK